MKRLHIAFAASLALAGTANATLIFNEPFAYPDGPITTVSSGTWTNHSGTAGQVDISSGKVNLTQSESEDVSAGLPGGPYSGTFTLYASMVVNFSGLPSGSAGGYFWHYRDTGTANFRARVFATTNGAASGKFRVGIANGGNTPEIIPTDLDLASDVKLVVRIINGTNCTLWINPTSEASMTSRADATDSTSAVPLHSVCLRQSLASGSGMGTLTLDDLKIGTAFSDVQTIGGPPSISGLVSTNIPANTSTGPMPFIVNDVETAATNLVVAATSDNPTLVPNNPANLTFGGSGENRTLTVTPATGQQGVANIAVVVTDLQGDKATNTFTLTVGQPTISAIGNQIAYLGDVTNTTFWVNDAETAPGSLTVTATSSDQTVLPDANIGIVNSGGTNRTLWLTNAAAGFAVVTVTVNDGVFTIPTTFTLTAATNNGILLAEDFSYPNGSLITNSAFLWNAHSGATGQTEVVNGKLPISFTRTEDVNRWFTNAPVSSTGGQIIFTRYVVNFTALPGAGEYFQHVYGFSGAFRARVYATTNGAAPGTLRLGITAAGFTPAVVPVNLPTNQNHVVITRYNTATAESTIWVNPVSETSNFASATDIATPITAYGVAFRQNTGIGSLVVDDLLVGSTFNQVFLSLAPSPIPLAITSANGEAIVSWNDPGGQFKLATGTNIYSVTNIINGATSPYTNNLGDAQRYFRLVYP